MTTRAHAHEEPFPVAPAVLFGILYTPSAIRGWWSAASAIVVPRAGGLWAATWGREEDAPDYVTSARMSVFDPPRRMVLSDYSYHAKDGPLPFEADFTTEFLVSEHADGAQLRVTQSGFPSTPAADAFLKACETGWRDTFAGIRRFLAQ